MRKKHDYSPNHKMVPGPHNFSENHGSAEPAGGGAQGPQMPMFCNGGKAYSDGGYTGPPSKMSMAVDAVKGAAGDLVNKVRSATSSDPVAEAQGQAQARRNKTIDDAERSAITGEDT
jgi:hypothetical protein